MGIPFRGPVVALASVLLLACGKGGTDGAHPVVGTWRLDASATTATLAPGSGPAAEAIASTLSRLETTVEFRADRTVRTTQKSPFPGSPAEDDVGTWEAKDGKVVVTPRTHNGKPAEGRHAQALDYRIEGDTLRFKPPVDMPVEFVFRRR
jgi:hypothetical protein